MKYNATHMLQIIHFAVHNLGGDVRFTDLVREYGEEEEYTNGAAGMPPDLDPNVPVLLVNSAKIKDGVNLTVLVLLHEAGHILSFQRGFSNKGQPVEKREQKAHLYGWAIAKRLKIPLEKGTWRRFNAVDKSKKPF